MSPHVNTCLKHANIAFCVLFFALYSRKFEPNFWVSSYQANPPSILVGNGAVEELPTFLLEGKTVNRLVGMQWAADGSKL